MSTFTLPTALSGKTTTITFPSHSESGQETSIDIWNKACNYLRDKMSAHPNLVFPTFAYKYEKQVRKISPKTVEMHYLKLVAECEYRLVHPESFIRPPAIETINFNEVTPSKPVEEKTYCDIVFPITPLNLIFKTPQPTKSVTFENIQLLTSGNTTPIGGRKLHIEDEPPKLIPFVPIQPEPEIIEPVEPTKVQSPLTVDSPIRININEKDQIAMIEPPCGWQGDFFGPLSYPWIFGGFTLAHLICEMDNGFSFIGRCSDQTLRKLLLDLQGIYELFRSLVSLPTGPDPEGIDTDWTYSSVLCNISLSEFDDGIGGIGAQGSIFNACKRRILTKVMIDLDELITAFRILLTKSPMERLTHVGFTNEEIRDHIHRIQSYQL